MLGHVSPASVCRKLSAIGRRVLSIESIAALQGVIAQRSYTVCRIMRDLKELYVGLTLGDCSPNSQYWRGIVHPSSSDLIEIDQDERT